jgi:DNA gyrase subunit B
MEMLMAKKPVKQEYGNESISALKGAERVRKRPGVIFGSDGLEGCEHAVFEILSNSIDEAKEGHGALITVTRYEDLSVEVEDLGARLARLTSTPRTALSTGAWSTAS